MLANEERLRIGTCGYSYPGPPPKGWDGVFYPRSGRRKTDELEFYASFFNTVEINSTFYRPATPERADAWAARTPSDFDFAVKAWQKFTHPARIGDQTGVQRGRWDLPNQADVEVFTRGIAPLADSGKLGVLLFQYPPGFRYEKKSIERLDWTLTAFTDYPKVVEFRHRSWSDRKSDTQAFLNGSRTAWAVIDEPKFASSVRQDFESEGDIVYYRLHGRNYQKWWNHREAWERYDYFYQPEVIRALGRKIGQMVRIRPQSKIFVLFNNHARGQAVANALMLKSTIFQQDKTMLPQTLLDAFPALTGATGTGSSGT